MTNRISENEKGHVPDDLDPDPSLSGSSSKNKKHNKKKKRCKNRKDDSLDPSSSDDSDYSNDIGYRRKLRKRRSDWGKYLIKLCACLTEHLLTTAYKPNITRFKMDGDLLQR